MPPTGQPFQEMLRGDQAQLRLDGGREPAYRVGLVEASPCTVACPAGLETAEFLYHARAGRDRQAMEVV